MGTILIFPTTIQMYSSFPYSIYISTEPIYTSLYTSCPYSYFSPHFFLCPFRAFLFFGQPILPYQKKISQKKTFQKKNFFFSSEKNFCFLGFPRKKIFSFYIFRMQDILPAVYTAAVGKNYYGRYKLSTAE